MNFLTKQPAFVRSLITGLGVLGSINLGLAATADAPKPRPNILVIFTDDQSYRTVGCYPGAPDWVRTPNIDRLATHGVRFSEACIGTWCAPSRMTLLTGHLQFGIESMHGGVNSSYDPAQCPFWPKVFRQHGYITAQIGKWHTGPDTGFGRDWDYQAVWNRPGHPENAGNYYYDQLIEFNGRPAELVKGYSTDNYTDWAVDFIKGANRNTTKPWFLWLCYGAVHGPHTPAQRHLDAYVDADVPVPPDIYPPRPGKPAYASERADWLPDAQGKPVGKAKRLTLTGRNGLEDWVRQYNQGVLAVDEGVGRLMQVLEATGQLANTLVVFTSDQGFAFGQHGFRDKMAPYDETLRGPLIVSLPGQVAEGKVCDAAVGGQDLAPTFFSFAGLALPWAMDGHDLTPLLREPAAAWPHPRLLAMTADRFGSDTAVVPKNWAELPYGDMPWWLSLTEGRYKYIRTLIEGETEELYDRAVDPGESHNLAREAGNRERLMAMRERLLTEMRRAGAKMTDHLPAVAEIR